MEPEHRLSSWLAAIDERRRESRFPKEAGVERAVVWQQPGDELLVDVHDESLHGLGLILPDAASFPIGAAATIVYQHEVYDATVRHVERLPSGASLVGFECRPFIPNDTE